jgi:hypothetical protein
MKFLHQLWANDQHLTGVLCNTVFKRIFSPLIDAYLENSINKGIPYTNLVDLVNGKRKKLTIKISSIFIHFHFLFALFFVNPFQINLSSVYYRFEQKFIFLLFTFQKSKSFFENNILSCPIFSL